MAWDLKKRKMYIGRLVNAALVEVENPTAYNQGMTFAEKEQFMNEVQTITTALRNTLAHLLDDQYE